MSRSCQSCGTTYDDEVLVCWRCRQRLGRAADELGGSGGGAEGLVHAGTGRQWVELEAIYKAPDEFSALAIQRVLLEAGVDSQVRSLEIPWCTGIMENLQGYWGEVLVAAEEASEARGLVGEYLRSLGP